MEDDWTWCRYTSGLGRLSIFCGYGFEGWMGVLYDVVLKIGWVCSVTVVNTCFLKPCCMVCVMVVISVSGSV